MSNTSSAQPELLPHQPASSSGPVTCLGRTFAGDEERRAYFLDLLAKKLREPAFRAIEGFPLGSDEDILALSDPPYYTACPNPFLPEIVAAWQAERAALHARLGLDDGAYHREPFAADVSEGKNDPIYNAHSYHTKVPHKAIMRYILHYTEPGDIIFDGFCGSGMAGVAAQLCGDKQAVESLGYRVDADGHVYNGSQRISRLGPRKTVLNDLSPAATFIAYNLNSISSYTGNNEALSNTIADTETAFGHLYSVFDDSVEPSRIGTCIYTIWSDTFICPNCSNEVTWWQPGTGEVKRAIVQPLCPNCGVPVPKREANRQFETVFDSRNHRPYKRAKRKPVLVNYVGYDGVRRDKIPSPHEISWIAQHNEVPVEFDYPSDELTKGERYFKDGLHLLNIERFDQFFTARNLTVLAAFRSYARRCNLMPMADFLVTSILQKTASLMHNIGLKSGRINLAGALPNVLYVPSTIAERNIFILLRAKLRDLITAANLYPLHGRGVTIQTGDSGHLAFLPKDCVDYIFVDPPFGSNLQYSELSELWEMWLGVRTNPLLEAIVSRHQKKNIQRYTELMVKCFERFYIVLKPSGWITVEFHNSSSLVWTAIQEALIRVGFIVTTVRVLDKGQGTRNQMTQEGAVNKDLAITAYKPRDNFVEAFVARAGTDSAVWIFVRDYLDQLPAPQIHDSVLEPIAERQNYLLFDRMVAYHIQRGVAVPMGAAQFYAGLKQHFVERDGMYFLPEQVPAYDKARLEADTVAQIALFVADEKSAITWLRLQLADSARTFQEIQPRFLQELHQARHEELPDLRVLLEENFLQDETGRWYAPDPNKAEDLEKLRTRGLLREFDTYAATRKKLKTFRSEAVRAGFAKAWRERDYATIVQVAQRLPEQALQEDPDLLMYYDNASLRTGG